MLRVFCLFVLGIASIHSVHAAEPVDLTGFGWSVELPFESSVVNRQAAADRERVYGHANAMIPELRIENSATIRTLRDVGKTILDLDWAWAQHTDKADILTIVLRETEVKSVLVQIHADTGKVTISTREFLTQKDGEKVEEVEKVTDVASGTIAYRDGDKNAIDVDHWQKVRVTDTNGAIAVFMMPADGQPVSAQPGYNPKKPVVQTKIDVKAFPKGKIAITNKPVGRPEIAAGQRYESFVRNVIMASRK